MRLRLRNHLVGTLRCAADAQHSITARQQALGDRVEDFVEGWVANLRRSRQIDQRQCKPFANDRHMAGAEDWERIRFHGAYICYQLGRNIAGT